MGWTVEYLRTKQKDKKPQLLTYWISKSSNIECLLNVGLSSGFCPHPPDLHITNKHQLYHAWTSASSSNRQISNQIFNRKTLDRKTSKLFSKNLQFPFFKLSNLTSFTNISVYTNFRDTVIMTVPWQQHHKPLQLSGLPLKCRDFSGSVMPKNQDLFINISEFASHVAFADHRMRLKITY